MKKRYVPIISFTVALLLVGSIVYAADKRKKSRLATHEPNEMSEETLRAEFLAASGEQPEKSPGTRTFRGRKGVVAKAKVK